MRQQGQRRPDEAALGAHERSQVRGSALLVLGRMLSLAIGMATSVIIVRVLSKADYGAFEYAITLAGAGRVLLSLGQGRLLSRFMAQYDEEGDYPRMFGSMLLAVGTIVVTSAGCITAIYLFADPILRSSVEGDTAVRLVLILIFVAPLEALDQVFVSLFAVFSKPRAIFFRKHLLGPGLQFVVVLVLALTGASVTFLAVGYLVAAIGGILLYVVLMAQVIRERHLAEKFSLRRIILPFKAVFSFSLPLITGELTLLSFKIGGVLVLGMTHGVVEIANYRVVFNPSRLNTAITTTFATLFLPVLARLYARRAMDELRQSYWHTAVFVAVFTFPIFALTGPLSEATTVTLFGERYAESAVVLSILATGYYFNVMLGFNAYALQVAGRIRYLVVVNLTIAALNVGLCFLLAPDYGAVGVALANCFSLVMQNVVNQLALRRSIHTPFIGRECWTAYGLVLVATLFLWGFRVLVHPDIFLSVLVAGLTFLGVLGGSQRALRLGETFPELRRVPILGRMVR